MGLDLQTAQRLATALLNLAVAVLMGATVSRIWLGHGASDWARTRLQPVRTAAIAGAVVALVVNAVWLWLESAAVAEVPVTEAAGAARTMLASTHLGLAWCIGMAGLVAATTGTFISSERSPGPVWLTLAGLAVFWYTRSMVSHASSDGDFSLRLVADWAHLGLISLWVGEVLVAGDIILKSSSGMATNDRRARGAYVKRLSDSATFALTGIFVTGVYAAWRGVDGWANLIGTPYGNRLVVKVLLAGCAAALGGFNRLIVMPPWLGHEAAGSVSAEVLPARFRRVLGIEALVLLAVVVMAAWLASTSPPGE